MTKEQEKIISKVVMLLISSIIAATGWMIKSDISSVSETLKDIREDVSNLNTKALLQEQEYAFKFKWIQKKLTSNEARIKYLESRLKSP